MVAVQSFTCEVVQDRSKLKRDSGKDGNLVGAVCPIDRGVNVPNL